MPHLLQILATTGRGGAEEYALTVAREAVDRGWAVTAAFPAGEQTTTVAKAYEQDGGNYRPLDCVVPDNVRFNHRRFAVVHAWRTRRLLRAVRPTVVHVVLPWPTFGYGVLLGCGLDRVPTAVTFQLATNHTPPVGGRTRRAYLWAKSRGQVWVAVSPDNRSVVADVFGLPADGVEVIPNGADPPPAGRDRETARQSLRRELGLPADAVVLLGVGRLHHQKGFDLLPPVLPHLVGEFPTAHLALAGDGPEREPLAAAFRDRGVGDRVHLLGRRPDVPDLLLAADLFVFPTRFEGHPFALLEAMAAGLPVVTSAASGIADMVVDRQTGLVVRPDDPCDLLEAVRWALRHPAEAARMGERGRAVAVGFSTERMLRATFDLLTSLGGAGGTASSPRPSTPALPC